MNISIRETLIKIYDEHDFVSSAEVYQSHIEKLSIAHSSGKNATYL